MCGIFSPMLDGARKRGQPIRPQIDGLVEQAGAFLLADRITIRHRTSELQSSYHAPHGSMRVAWVGLPIGS